MMRAKKDPTWYTLIHNVRKRKRGGDSYNDGEQRGRKKGG